MNALEPLHSHGDTIDSEFSVEKQMRQLRSIEDYKASSTGVCFP